MKMNTGIMASLLAMMLCSVAQSGERRTLSENVLTGEFLETYLGRVEDQHDDFQTWFPGDRLKTATILSIVEYQDGVAFVCFSQKTEVITNNTWTVVRIHGPAVVFPTFPDNKEAKFKNNRYVGAKKKADWSKRDRHFWDKDVIERFERDTGKHGNITRVTEFEITDRLIGEEKTDDEGRDKRMTDRQMLARLMGVYFPGP